MGWYRKFRDNAKGPQGHKRTKVFAAWHGEFENPLFTDEALPQSFPGTCFFNQDGEFHFVSDTVDPPPRRNASRRTPLTDMLANRSLALVITAALLLQVWLTRFALPAWPCPISSAIHFPCPGCGLSRGAAAWIRGDWVAAFGLHAFAPFLVLAGVAWAIVSVLPGRPHAAVLRILQRSEERFPVAAVFLGLFIFYWIARFVLDRERLFSLST